MHGEAMYAGQIGGLGWSNCHGIGKLMVKKSKPRKCRGMGMRERTQIAGAIGILV